MGGSGSGRRWHYGARLTTGACPALDVRRLARGDALVPGREHSYSWTWRHGRKASIFFYVQGSEGGRATGLRLAYTVTASGSEPEVVSQQVDLTWTACYYGGHRPWFVCPRCGRRVAILYGRSRFGCRACQRLAYPSQNESAADRQMRKAQAIRERLGGSPDLSRPFPPKPPRMHWRTYARLREQASEAEVTMWADVAERFGLTH